MTGTSIEASITSAMNVASVPSLITAGGGAGLSDPSRQSLSGAATGANRLAR